MGHGGGGKLSAELVEHLFRPAFDSQGEMCDAAVFEVKAGRLAYSTDSYVVHPLFFPGGDIGKLAIHGTVNDLAMMGATPLFMSVGFILEEGFELEALGRIAQSMGEAARQCGVKLVTGDTKVVDRGHGHGVYINTSGIGRLPEGRELGPERARGGDAILVSGPLGNHGMAIMSLREGLAFDSTIESDTACLSPLVELLMEEPEKVRVLRDPTRGGLASSLNEIAESSGVGMMLEECTLPVDPDVKGACEFLGLDPLYVANEGKLVAIVDPDAADDLLAKLHAHPLGRGAARIGYVTTERPGMVALKTAFGGTRVVDTQVGEQLPRIC